MEQKKNNQYEMPQLSVIYKLYYTSYEIWFIFFVIFAFLRVNCTSPVMESQFWLGAGVLIPLSIRMLFEMICALERKILSLQYVETYRQYVADYLLTWHFCWYLVGLTVYFTMDTCDLGYLNYKMKLKF